MKAVVWYVVLAVLLLTAGVVFWTSGQLERRLVDAHKQLVTLRYAAPGAEYVNIERSIHYADRLPWVATLEANTREQRATAEYWLSDYHALELPRDAAGALIEQDPQILFLAANAAYRAVRLNGGDQPTDRQLENVMTGYAEVLRRSQGHADAAYNYEFVARLRDQLVRRASRPRARGKASSEAPQAPLGRTIHGHVGAPPLASDMNKFKIVIPQSSDERKDEQLEAGKGARKIRKG